MIYTHLKPVVKELPVQQTTIECAVALDAPSFRKLLQYLLHENPSGGQRAATQLSLQNISRDGDDFSRDAVSLMLLNLTTSKMAYIFRPSVEASQQSRK